MQTGFSKAIFAVWWCLAYPAVASAQDIIAPTEFREVLFAERQVAAEHLVVGVVAKEVRRNVPRRPNAIFLRGRAPSTVDQLCGEVRSLDGLYFGEMLYSAPSGAAAAEPTLLGYPSEKAHVFEYESADLAVRLNDCNETGPPSYRVASWLGVATDRFDGAEILLNTQSGTDVYAFLGSEPLTCEREPDGDRQEIDFRCLVTADQIDPSLAVSLIVDRAGSRDPVVQIYISR